MQFKKFFNYKAPIVRIAEASESINENLSKQQQINNGNTRKIIAAINKDNLF